MIKYFDIDISSVVVYIGFTIFMVACFFVLPKDIPMGLVLPKKENIQEQLLMPSAPPKIMS
jgi:phage shock protein PspC (stress-responsive transcriptional regulator)